MRQRIRLIASDLDGTLVGEGSPLIDPLYYDVIQSLNKEGIVFAAFTGRHIDSARRLFGPVKELVTYVCDNGAIIGTSERVIRTIPMPESTYQSLLMDAVQLTDCQLLVTTAEQGYVPSDAEPEFINMLQEQYRFDVSAVSDLNRIREVIKFSVYNTRDVAEATGVIRDRHRQDLYSVVAGTRWVDFMMPQVGKGKALRLLLDELKLDASECMAFGDQMNDLEMIQTAGIGVAVEHAVPACMEASDLVIPGWEQNGVLKVLQKLVNGGGVYEY